MQAIVRKQGSRLQACIHIKLIPADKVISINGIEPSGSDASSINCQFREQNDE